MYTWLCACFPFSWLGQPSGKTLLTALHKYFYQTCKAFPSHPAHAKGWFVFLSCCKCPGWQCSPALEGELSSSDGCAASGGSEHKFPRWMSQHLGLQQLRSSLANSANPCGWPEQAAGGAEAGIAPGCSRKNEMLSESALSENSRWILYLLILDCSPEAPAFWDFCCGEESGRGACFCSPESLPKCALGQGWHWSNSFRSLELELPWNGAICHWVQSTASDL